jgi:hypothetical protein
MQRWFLILMLVLLPARGWSAQLMGMEMGAAQMATVQMGAAHHASMPFSSDAMADMPADCPMHMAASAQEASTSADQQHPTCQACQLCMPLAVLGHTGFTLGHQRCPMPLPQARMSFVSAELALAVKPPIR